VITFSDDRVSAITRFDNSVLPGSATRTLAGLIARKATPLRFVQSPKLEGSEAGDLERGYERVALVVEGVHNERLCARDDPDR